MRRAIGGRDPKDLCSSLRDSSLSARMEKSQVSYENGENVAQAAMRELHYYKYTHTNPLDVGHAHTYSSSTCTCVGANALRRSAQSLMSVFQRKRKQGPVSGRPSAESTRIRPEIGSSGRSVLVSRAARRARSAAAIQTPIEGARAPICIYII